MPNAAYPNAETRGCFLQRFLVPSLIILTKFHCAFIQDDAEDNSSSICFVLAQLNQFVLNHRNSTITLNGLPKGRKIMFYIRIHIIEVAGVTEEVAIQLALCGQSWSSAPLRLAKSTRALDSGSPWVESRLVCKDLSESMYPSKCQLSESPPLAVDTVPSFLGRSIVRSTVPGARPGDAKCW